MLESLTVEVVVRPGEAQLGGTVRVSRFRPRARVQPAAGTAVAARTPVGVGKGHGVLTTEHPVDVEHPPCLRDGYAVRIALARFGIENFYLTMLFRVSGAW